ncbi:YciI family protein [Nocardia sp. NPDC004068]|uniref:YciI family protein n=1 Tax=Nocardia sp. NPDC004068 TaxID=3364303 RepID=UPI0036B656C5
MKYMLLKSYDPAASTGPEWTPEEIRAHIEFQRVLGEELRRSGELVDAQGLAFPDQARIVRSDGRSAPVVTDGPFPESKEFLAGYWIVDVDTPERALEIAARASAAPGPGGEPIAEAIEVRQVMSAPAGDL